MKVLHIVGGKLNNGAVKGAKILHEALLDQKIDSLFINDTPSNSKEIEKNIIYKQYPTKKFFIQYQ